MPGSPMDPRARGANDLLRQGAFLVEEADDVLRVLDAQRGVSEPETTSPGPIDGAADVFDDADLQRLGRCFRSRRRDWTIWLATPGRRRRRSPPLWLNCPWPAGRSFFRAAFAVRR